jgi:hypothetical protein
VLVDLEYRSDRTWHLVGFTTQRLAEVVNQKVVLEKVRNEGLRLLTPDTNDVPTNSLPSTRVWEDFREVARKLCADELNEVIRRNWPAPDKPTDVTVLVMIRTLLLEPEVAVSPSATPSWVKLVPFHAAAAEAAAKVRTEEIKIDCSQTRISLAPGGERIEVAVLSPVELLIDQCEIVVGTRQIWRAAVSRIVRRQERTALPSLALPAEAVRCLASSGDIPTTGGLHISVRGRAAPFSIPLPVANLPPARKVADLFLDLGSTSTKWVLQVDGRKPEAKEQETSKLTENWGVEAYRKAELIADASGERWCEWLARVLPAIRRWAGDKHEAYLRHIYLSLPMTEQFDVERLSADVMAAAQHTPDYANPQYTQGEPGNSERAVPTPRAAQARELLKATISEHLVAPGRVRLVPEHKLVAAHYLDVLRILQKAVQGYADRFKSLKERSEEQARRLEQWEARKKAVDEYDARWWGYRWVNDRPTGPEGERPVAVARITNPAEWMNSLIDHPQQFDQGVLLDVGGLSLDISVLEKHRLVLSLSKSDVSCGGEAISARIGRKETGLNGTRNKARLGKMWCETHRLTDKDQIEYREVTRTLCEPPLKPLFQALGVRWKHAPHCFVLLTGGGARNPHLAELVSTLSKQEGIIATLVDADMVQGLIEQARVFPEPLSDLESPLIQRFEETQSWSADREQHRSARYDKFAVVGGMRVLEGGPPA